MALFSIPALRIVPGDPESRNHTFRISRLTLWDFERLCCTMKATDTRLGRYTR